MSTARGWEAVEERGVGGGMTVGSAGESVQKEGGGGALGLYCSGMCMWKSENHIRC